MCARPQAAKNLRAAHRHPICNPMTKMLKQWKNFVCNKTLPPREKRFETTIHVWLKQSKSMQNIKWKVVLLFDGRDICNNLKWHKIAHCNKQIAWALVLHNWNTNMAYPNNQMLFKIWPTQHGVIPEQLFLQRYGGILQIYRLGNIFKIQATLIAIVVNAALQNCIVEYNVSSS